MIDPQTISERLSGSIAAVQSLRGQIEAVATLAGAVIESLARGGTIYTCGNGGSAAEAIHLAEELIGFYRRPDRAALRAVCLSADPAALTCIANDVGFEHVFSRQVEALLGEDDVLVAFSTSGASANIVNALQAAQVKGAKTIGLLGKGGGRCAAHCDHALIVASEDSAHIQEAHLVVIHLICEAVERMHGAP